MGETERRQKREGDKVDVTEWGQKETRWRRGMREGVQRGRMGGQNKTSEGDRSREEMDRME